MKRFFFLSLSSLMALWLTLSSCDPDSPIVIDPRPIDSVGDSGGSGGGSGGSGGGSGGSGGSGDSDSTQICFERDILPIFLSNCAMSGCHDAQSHEGDYILTSYETITAKGIVPYYPERSEIYRVLLGLDDLIVSDSPILSSRRDDDDDDDYDDDGDDDRDDGDDEGDEYDDNRMPPPPYPPLPQDKIDLIYQWIAEGAKNTSCDSTGGSGGGSGGSGCDTLDMSYAQDIQPILSTHCVGCHTSAAPSGNVVLDNYNSVKEVALNGKLYGSVAHLPGYKAMPPNNNQLDNCSIDKIRAWVNQGAPPLTFRFAHDLE